MRTGGCGSRPPGRTEAAGLPGAARRAERSAGAGHPAEPGLAARPGTTDMLAAVGSMLTAWRLTGQPARWARTQAIKVPIQYGSSSGS